MIMLCPWPDELMIGLTTQGMPISFTAASNSARSAANRYGEVAIFNSSAASSSSGRTFSFLPAMLNSAARSHRDRIRPRYARSPVG